MLNAAPAQQVLIGETATPAAQPRPRGKRTPAPEHASDEGLFAGSLPYVERASLSMRGQSREDSGDDASWHDRDSFEHSARDRPPVPRAVPARPMLPPAFTVGSPWMCVRTGTHRPGYLPLSRLVDQRLCSEHHGERQPFGVLGSGLRRVHEDSHVVACDEEGVAVEGDAANRRMVDRLVLRGLVEACREIRLPQLDKASALGRKVLDEFAHGAICGIPYVSGLGEASCPSKSACSSGEWTARDPDPTR